MNIIQDLPPVFPKNTYVAVDSEWFNLNPNTLHRPTSGSFACMTVCENGKDVYFLDTQEKALEAIKRIQNCTWLIHEAKFDLTHLGRFVPRDLIRHTQTIDTLMMEKILYGGYYNRFGLGHLVRRYLDVYLEKELQKSFQGDSMSQEQVEYACRDAMYLRRVWSRQRKNITKEEVYIYKNVDRPTMFSVMDFMGFGIDAVGWRNLAVANRAEQERIDAEFAKSVPYTPRQFKKLKEWLSEHGFPKIDSTNEATLIKFLAKYPDTEAGDATQKILDSRMYGKRASTYGVDWLDKYLEIDSDGTAVVMCNYDIDGTETSRMVATAPPMQVIPQRETKEYRKLFIPHKNHVLIVGDFSQQEVGVIAYLSQDKKLIQMFNMGKDIYILTAKEMFGRTITKKDPLRALMKALVLGMNYGLSKYGLAARMSISLDEAEDHIRKFLKTFPGVDNYQRKQRKITSYITSVLGRKVWLDPYSSQCENNALNAPVQCSAAEMLKISINDMHNHWTFPCPFGLVGAIHDELIMDIPVEYAKHGQEFMKNSMESMASWLLPGMNFKADVHICPNNWSEKDVSEE